MERVPLPTRASRLKELYFPKTVLGADLVVSMPKLKTHHWAGVTLSLKNMFGVVPGAATAGRKTCCTGRASTKPFWTSTPPSGRISPSWTESSGMEGNGPIQGTPKASGALIFGDDPVAVDATCCRVMGLVPERIKYLASAGTMLGHVNSR